MDDFTDLPDRHIVALVVHDAGLHVQYRLARGARLSQLVLGLEYGGSGGDFRLAIEIPQADLRKALLYPLHDLHRHDRSAVVTLDQGGEIGAVETGRVEE